MKIMFLTSNPNKLEEAKKILEGHEIEHINISIPEMQGESEDIVKEKAKIAALETGKAVFVDDTSLYVTALGDLPGPYITYFMKKLGAEKFPRLLDSFDDKSAKAACYVGFCEPNKEPVIFLGEVEGEITDEALGLKSFGFDPIFKPKGHDKTYAQMEEEKHKMSHRYLALMKLKEYLDK